MKLPAMVLLILFGVAIEKQVNVPLDWALGIGFGMMFLVVYSQYTEVSARGA
jgi:hypothetical protein